MDTCIVCLGDLRTVAEEPPPSEAQAPLPAEASNDGDAKKSSRILDAKSLENDEEAIAHLLPCKHDLHNACLKPWVERANSCPICRATFNMVELCEHLHGPALSSYAVQDKSQEAEVDPGMIVEDELFAVDTWEPCLVCGTTDDTAETMYCDRCETAVHVFCAGFDQSPEHWYCHNCLNDMERGASARRRPRRRVPNVNLRETQNRGRRNDALWARIWQEVSRSVDLDLDFPFDDEPPVDQRTPEQRREFERWQRRFEVANQQGATSRLRNMATARIRPSNNVPEPIDPESQEEIRAWNAFDKARESQDAPPNLRRRKRRRTDSPASPVEPEPADRPPQKRPRLRRLPGATPQVPSAPAESSHAAAQRAGGDDGPTFLSSLLREVECQPMSASSPGPSDMHNGQMSPRESSPEMSPSPSGGATPREGSASPLPSHTPLSPPLSATHIPLSSPIDATFSPFSPTGVSEDQNLSKRIHQRGRQRSGPHSPPGSDVQLPFDRGSSASPSRGLSYSAKEEIQRMVKAALKPHYRHKRINKDDYTEINRDVSRRLYDMVGDASALSDQRERERFQEAADEEVSNAVSALNETVFLE